MYYSRIGGVVGGKMYPELTILVSDDFAANQSQGLVGREGLRANIIVNIPFENYLHIIITSSRQDAFYFVLANAF